MRRRVMTTKASTRIAIWSVFLVAGVIAAGVAIVLLLGGNSDKKRCTQPVTAVVVENAPVPSMKNIGQFNYAAVFEYEYRGQTYRYQSRTSTNPPRYQVGQRVELKIDPDNPLTAYDGSGGGNLAGFIVLGASAIYLFLGIFGVSLNVKRIKANNGSDYIPPSHSNWN